VVQKTNLRLFYYYHFSFFKFSIIITHYQAFDPKKTWVLGLDPDQNPNSKKIQNLILYILVYKSTKKKNF